MTIGGPRIFEGLLPLGGGRVLGYNHAAGMYYIMERTAVGSPEIYWFDGEEDLPPGVGEDVVGMLEGEVFPPQEDNQVMSSEEEEEDEEWDERQDEDSGYESMSGDEEDFEDDDEEDVRPRSPLVQQLPPGRPEQRAGPPPGLPSEESAPSTSGLGSSAKRSREESDTEQVGTKRQPLDCEDGCEESAPSTSALGSSTNRSHDDSAPSTSGLGPSTFRRSRMRPLPSDDSDSD